MANIDGPHGFRPIGPIRRITKYNVDSGTGVTMFHNDLVTQETDGNCTRLSSENFILGSIVWIKSTAGIPLKYRPTSTAVTIGVADHPDQEFECQVNSTYVATSRAANADITDTAGNIITGMSAQELDYSGISDSSDLHVKINRLLDQPGNAVGAAANVIVTINQHQRGHGDGSTGFA